MKHPLNILSRDLSIDEKQVLLVTTREDLAADLLIVELRRRGTNYFRLNCEDFPTSACMSWTPVAENGILSIKGQHIPLDKFKSAWYRRLPLPTLPVRLESSGLKHFIFEETEAFLNGFWDTQKFFWVNKPSKARLAENKLIQLSIAEKVGFKIPKTIVTNNPQKVKEFSFKEYSAIAKAISIGCLELDNHKWGIYAHQISPEDLLNEQAIQVAPFILQERIKKRAELRITVVGKKLFSTEIVLEGCENEKPDWHLADERFIRYKKYKIPDSLAARCLQTVEHLGLVYAAFDFVITPEEKYIFLEVNPSGQWGWIEHETGYPITRTLADLLIQGRC